MIDLIKYKKKMHINGEYKDKYSLRINPKSRLDFDKLCALIAERTTLTDYEVKFALAEVMQVVVENIELGRGTELGPLGGIELAVKANAVDSEEEVNKNLVEKTKIIYKPSKEMKKALRDVKYKIDK